MNLSLRSQNAYRRVAACASLVSVTSNGFPNIDGRATDTVLFGCLYPGIRLRWIGFGGCFIVAPFRIGIVALFFAFLGLVHIFAVYFPLVVVFVVCYASANIHQQNILIYFLVACS